MPETSIADTERRLALEWSAPGEFSSPTEVLIPAGATGTTFAVEALDDSVVDGRSRVLLTARMAGFAPAEMEFKLDDNESGNLRLSLPSSIREGTIHMEQPCWVSMPAAVQHDTEVALVGFGRLHLPARVIVPAGAQSARFNLRILNDRYNNLPPMDDRIRATTSGWPPAVASMAVVDDDARGFTLQLPQRVLEGIPSTAKVQFYAPFGCCDHREPRFGGRNLRYVYERGWSRVLPAVADQPDPRKLGTRDSFRSRHGQAAHAASQGRTGSVEILPTAGQLMSGFV